MSAQKKNQPRSLALPYNFVPVPDKVVEYPAADRISHDVPFRDGLSGHLSISLTAETRLFTKAGSLEENTNKDFVHEFFRLPSGEYAVPGSTFRGMIRSVLEIISHSKMALVEDKRFGVRDLTDTHGYLRKLVKGKPWECLDPQAKPGWLDTTGKVWKLTPCKHARIEQSELERHHKPGLKYGLGQKRDGKLLSAEGKYRVWGEDLELACRVGMEEPQDHTHTYFDDRTQTEKERVLIIRYRKAQIADRSATDAINGRIVFTGQPTEYVPGEYGNKHMEFFFYDESEPIEVDESVARDFEIAHYEGDSEIIDRFKGRIPVFFTENNKTPAAIGLAQLIRLAANWSVHDVLPGEHLSARWDLTEAMFGRSRGTADDVGGRVSFGTLSGKPDSCRPGKPLTLLLGGPKASFYLAYLKQNAEQKDPNTWLNQKTPRLRGWKRYPLKTHERTPEQSPNSQTTTFTPLEKGAEFTGRIRFHNLQPFELGALLWAIRLGDGDKPRHLHRLGLAKAFDFGEVQVTVDWDQSQILNTDWQPVGGEKAEANFEDWMDRKSEGRWRGTAKTLLAMTDPAQRLVGQFSQHPELRRFRSIKKFRQALTPHSDLRKARS